MCVCRGMGRGGCAVRCACVCTCMLAVGSCSKPAGPPLAVPTSRHTPTSPAARQPSKQRPARCTPAHLAAASQMQGDTPPHLCLAQARHVVQPAGSLSKGGGKGLAVWQVLEHDLRYRVQYMVRCDMSSDAVQAISLNEMVNSATLSGAKVQ